MGAAGYPTLDSSPPSSPADLSSVHSEVKLLRDEIEKLKEELAQGSSSRKTTTNSNASNKLKAEAEKLRAKAAKLEAEAGKVGADGEEDSEEETTRFSDSEIILLTALSTVSAIGFGMFLLVAAAFRRN